MSDGRRFVVVGDGDPEVLLGAIAARAELEAGEALGVRRTFLDTADGRLAGSGTTLELRVPVRGEGEAALVWVADDTGEVLATVPRPDGTPPRFATDLPPGPVAERLADSIDVRALLPQAEVMSRLNTYTRRDAEGKAVVRVVLDQSTPLGGATLPTLVEVAAVRGYAKAAEELGAVLRAQVTLEPIARPLVALAREALGAPPFLVTKLKLQLDAEAPAEDAWREVLRTLFDAVEANLEGTRADIDTEFLHDLRVAVRRTRSVLKEGRRILPDDLRDHWRVEFKWLGDVTTPTRDADVHLLDLPGLVATLPAERAADLEPLRDLLVEHQRASHAQLVDDLASARFAQLRAGWARFLESPWAGAGRDARRPAGEVTAARLSKAWNQVVRDGRAIGDATPAASLHDLRKDAKRLRYLLECFGSTLDPEGVATVVKALKGLQDVLGEFQDTEVQAVALERYADELVAAQAPASAVLAMGTLIEHLHERGRRARGRFAERFAAFDDKPTRKVFRHLIEHPGGTSG